MAELGTEGYLKANSENQMVRREAQSRQALYAAEGGIEWAKAHLALNSGLRQGNFSLATGQVKVDIKTNGIETNEDEIETNGENYTVVAEGRSGLALRKIEVKLQLLNGKWVEKSYQELHR